MYKQNTGNVVVNVKPIFLPDQSTPRENVFAWAYEVNIKNQGKEIVQLLYRNWVITDMNGHVEKVEGPGVVGLQPIIKPGETFSYSSFCVLPTPDGSMKGQYQFQTLDRETFDADIPEFQLTCSFASGDTDKRQLH